MKKIGNLFFLAEKQLIKEKKEKIIPCYTILDILDYAIQIRRFLDNNGNKVKKIMKLTKKDTRIRHNEAQRRYYIKKGE